MSAEDGLVWGNLVSVGQRGIDGVVLRCFLLMDEGHLFEDSMMHGDRFDVMADKFYFIGVK